MSKTATAWDASYRPDIDGLRAVAVLSVVIFHVFPAAIPGGFAGVDVFFVISGYLITGIILRERAAKAFSLVTFYARRIRRIFPALALVLALVLGFAWWSGLPHEFLAISRNTAASVVFAANFAFWSEINYFDPDKLTKPLLHLWSLGIEEQFYLVWPLLLMLVPLRFTRIAMAAMAAASFAACVIVTASEPDTAFYLPFTRFWELAVGGLLAATAPSIALSAPLRNAASGIGAALLAASFSILDSNAFPGAWALLPVAGSALVIAAGPNAPFNAIVLGSRVPVFIGLISYPLYLWHWPLLSFATIINLPLDGVLPGLIVIALSILCAWLTWVWVERSVRHRKGRAVVAALVAVMLAIGAVGLLGATGLLKPRLASSDLAQAISRAATEESLAFAAPTEKFFRGEITRFPSQVGGEVVFIGDSNMLHYLPRIDELAARPDPKRLAISFITRGGCPPVTGVAKERNKTCLAFLKAALDEVRRPEVKRVVFAALWVPQLVSSEFTVEADGRFLPLDQPEAQARALLNFETQVAELNALGKDVVIVLPSPNEMKVMQPTRLLPVCARLGFCPAGPSPTPETYARADAEALTSAMRDKLVEIARRTGARTADPYDTLCGAERCPLSEDDGTLVYRDERHLSADYVRRSFDMLDAFTRQ
ncbi:acyltransferase family protein [Aestuariivirga sp.]|uniref:acyltransferase family protein n=1 Tax=Aestuariivirga sp. TaxID=2650926 RepID=UPI003593A9AC